MTTASKTTTKTELMIESPTPTFYLTTETAKLAAHQCGTRTAKGGETEEEEHNDLRAVRSSLSDRRRSRRCRCRPVDGGVLKCKIQKERIGRRGRRFRLLIMKKKNDFR